MSSAPRNNSKKPYERPKLKLYGSVEIATAAVDVNSATMDGGGAGMNKTH